MIAALAVTDDGGFSIATLIMKELGLPLPWATRYLDIIMSAIVALVITVAAVMMWRRLRNTEQSLLPDGHLTLTNVMEMIVEFLLRLMGNIMGPERARRHLPLIGPLFVYLLVSNLLGILPGFYPSTGNINTNLACAIVVFIYYNYYGIKEQGALNYFRHMTGPIIWLAPLIFATEIVSHIVRPVSLSVRLMGNIAGDHMVLEVFSSLVPLFLPMVFMGLAIFTSILQAFVFTLLSIIYIQMASASEES